MIINSAMANVGMILISFILALIPYQAEAREIEPADVFTRVALLRGELELLRYEMGKPKSYQPEIKVAGAVAREVYAQAIALFELANRFCYEHTQELAKPPDRQEGKIIPTHVFDLVNAALNQIGIVKLKYNINEQIQELPRDPRMTPSDVYRSIINAQRQLNILLDRQVTPTDVYLEVTTAIEHASRLLLFFPDAESLPATPHFERGKVPVDVYYRLVRCYGILQNIAERSGIKILKLEEINIDSDRIDLLQLNDNHYIATLIVSEFSYLSQLMGNEPTLLTDFTYFLERRFPSHVYQKLGVLEEQLVELNGWVAKVPNWLGE